MCRFFARALGRHLLNVVVIGLLVASPVALSASGDDPYEDLNRSIFALNDGIDTIALRPAAKFYDSVLPEPVQGGVNNALNNLYDVNAALNALLQGRVDLAFKSTGRVAINTVLGFFGLFDVATDMGIERYRTDFGHTLSIWGVPKGPYVMLPILGPRTLRSAVGSGVDGWVSPVWQNMDESTAWVVRGVDVVNFRASLLETDQLITGDRYIFLRDVYLQQRSLMTGDGAPTDGFSDFEDDWEEDEP